MRDELNIIAVVDELCDRFDSRWASGERPQLEEFLSDLPVDVRPRALRDLLSVEREYREKNGESATLAEYLSRLPEHESTLREIFDQGDTEQATLPLDSPTSVPTSSSKTAKTSKPAGQGSAADFPQQIAGYEIIDRLGIGGMGAVYRARQIGADREVALKVIRPDCLASLASDDRESITERFLREAKTTANLRHENIVTTYEVGEQNGVHYFSMQLVHGESLIDKVRDQPLDGKIAAGYLEKVADAIQFAHDQNILHRDLKPHNILIERDTDRPLVADFGLAKLLESGGEDTRTGAVLGSPPYMSPEQVQDSGRVQPATDIYGLGATLYQLLTGRPPFQSAKVVDVLLQVTEQLPVPPRQLIPAIDQDLESICLKCLEKSPSGRYASAGELAEDLRRYQQGIPTVARPLNAVGRYARWCRRNPLLAGMSAAASALLVLLVVVLGIANYVTSAQKDELETNNTQLVKLNEELQAANASEIAARELAVRREAEALSYLNQSEKAVFQFFVEVTQSRELLLGHPGVVKLRTKLLTMAQEYFVDFLKQRSTVGGQYLHGQVLLSLAQIQFEQGQLDAALATVSKSRALFEEVDEKREDSYLITTARTYELEGMVQIKKGDYGAAKTLLEKAMMVASETPVDQQDETFVERQVSIRNNLSVALQRSGELPRAAEVLTEAIELQEARMDDAADDVSERMTMAGLLFNRGTVAMRLKQLDDAATWFKKTAEVRKKTVELSPNDPQLQSEWYATLLMQATVAQASQDFEEAEKYYLMTLPSLQKLADSNPGLVLYREQLGMAHFNFALLHRSRGQVLEMEKAFENAMRDFSEVVEQAPKELRSQRALEIAKSQLAHSYQQRAYRMATAPIDEERDGKEAVRIATTACELKGPDSGFLETLAAAYAECGEFDQAIKTIDKALEFAPERFREILSNRRARYENKKPLRAAK